MRQETCLTRNNIDPVAEGPCADEEGEEVEAIAVERMTVECPSQCSFEFSPVCGSDGRTYNNKCHLRVEACRAGSKLKIIHKGQFYLMQMLFVVILKIFKNF